nr:aminotransferase class V-fold PLP-dependent enzyme [Clostridioides difficile]
MKKTYLFSPGPVMVTDRVRNSLLHYDICHRGNEFMNLFKDTQQKISKLYNATSDYYSLVVSGSGTSVNECVLSSIFDKEDAALLVSNGVFGERLEEILSAYSVKTYKPDFKWAEYPDLDILEKYILENPDIKVIAMVFHETSSGMINPVPELGKLAKKYNKIFFVDAISASAGEYIDVDEFNIDIITGVGGKALGAFPGSAYLCAKESVLQNIKENQCKNVYLSLYKHYKLAKSSSQTPNTPNVTLIFALNEALTEFLEDDSKIERYKECSAILRNGMEELGLTFLLPDKYMSNTVTSVFLPKEIDINRFILELEEENGYVVYPGKGKFLDDNMFQVANMGEIYPDDCYKFLDILKSKLEIKKAI